MTKHLIATGHTIDGQFVVTTATADALADLAIANLDAANLATCRALGIIPPGLVQGVAQHDTLVDVAKKAVRK